jgi:ribosomal protein L40E
MSQVLRGCIGDLGCYMAHNPSHAGFCRLYCQYSNFRFVKPLCEKGGKAAVMVIAWAARGAGDRISHHINEDLFMAHQVLIR